MHQPSRFPILLLVLAIASAVATPAAAQRPSRDNAPPRRPSGTASISGHVLAADTGRPLPRARVSATLHVAADGAGSTSGGAETSSSYATLTDHNGAFVIGDLPAGLYAVSAAKSPYLSVNYGATRPQRPGKRVTLKQGQQAREVDVRLPRGGVLTGRVSDEGGEPIVRAMVQALRQTYLQGEARVVPTGMAQTDDRGQFRIYGLAPGSYVVSASAYMEGVSAEDARPGDPAVAQTYAPTYYPGVTNAAEAVAVMLGTQQEYSNVDFVLQAVPTARVTGTVVGEAGTVGAAAVILFVDDPRGVTSGSTYGGRVQEDGSFTIPGVPPGRYLAIARAGITPGARGGRGGGADGRPPLIGVQPVSVAGQDVTGVTIPLASGGTVSGWVTVESASGQRLDFNQLRLTTTPTLSMPFAGSETARVQSDGSFTLSNLIAGSHLVRVTYPPNGWALKGVFVNGKDVSDQPLEIKSGQSTAGLQVVLTDRVTSVTAIVDGGVDAASDCYLVLFPTDGAAWRPRSRAIIGRRPDEAGSARFTGVPPGDYYLAVAPDLEAGSWYDPQLLGELAKTAARVSLEEGDTKTVTLKVPSQTTEKQITETDVHR